MYTLGFIGTEADMVAAALALEDREGLVVTHDHFDPLLDAPDKAQNLAFTAYAETQDQAKEAGAILAALGYSAAIEALEDQDWVSLSQAGLAAVQAGPWRIHGSHEPARLGRRRWQLRIDANTAFGTGHHETTRGCLLAMEALRKRQSLGRVLDLGTGTGVLALAALRAGASAAVATDIDPEATARATANARANAVARLPVLTCAGTAHADLRRGQRFDLVFANILAGPLVALAADISRITAPGGYVLLAGLIKPQRQGVEAAYRNQGLLLQQRLILGDWPTLVFRKPA